MNKTLKYAALILTAIVATSLVFAFALNGNDRNPHIESTEDIGARLPQEMVTIESDIFVPKLTREEVVALVRSSLKAEFPGSGNLFDGLPIRATVGRFSGVSHLKDQDFVQDVRAWIITVEGIPMPRGGPKEQVRRPEDRFAQAAIVLDSETGEEIFGVYTWPPLK